MFAVSNKLSSFNLNFFIFCQLVITNHSKFIVNSLLLIFFYKFPIISQNSPFTMPSDSKKKRNAKKIEGAKLNGSNHANGSSTLNSVNGKNVELTVEGAIRC